jgi:hypothetical protein
MRPQIIVDCETTSLTPDYANDTGVIWELALIERGSGARWLWRMPPDPEAADPKALEIGRFAERTAGMRRAAREDILARYGSLEPAEPPTDVWNLAGRTERIFWSDPDDLALILPDILQGATLIAANPTFDAGFLSAFLAHHGENPQPWHYRLRDIESMAWAWLNGRNTHEYARCTGRYEVPPMDAGTDDFARVLGVDLKKFDRHAALGDCELVAAILRVMEGGAP